MSAEIINVLNYIGEQFGIVIDWSSTNVLPQVMDILGRYRIFQIVELSSWLVIFAILAIVLACFGKSVIKSYKLCMNDKSENIWFYHSSYHNNVIFKDSAFAYMTILGIYLFITAIITPIIVGSILEWVFVPEIKYLEVLNGYLN